MLEHRITAASSVINEAVLGGSLLKLFRGVTRGTILEAAIVDKEVTETGSPADLNIDIARLSGYVRLPGFEQARVPAFLASDGVVARFTLGSEVAPVITVESGAFDEKGNHIRDYSGDQIVGLAHVLAVTNEKKGWQPWDTEALLYDRMLAAVRGYLVKEVGVKAAGRYLFYRD